MHRVIYTCERVQVPSQLNSAKFNCCTENLMQSYRSGCFPRDIYMYMCVCVRAENFYFTPIVFPIRVFPSIRIPAFFSRSITSRYQPLTSRVAVSSREVIRSKNHSLDQHRANSKLARIFEL